MGGGSISSSNGLGGKRCSRRTSAGKLGLDAAGPGAEEDGVSGVREDEEVDVVVSVWDGLLDGGDIRWAVASGVLCFANILRSTREKNRLSAFFFSAAP